MKALLLFSLIFTSLQAADLSDLTWTVSGGKVTITDCEESATGHLDIPASIEGSPVTALGNSAFRNCSSLTNIVIPNSITSIKGGVFSGCSGLTIITIPAGVTSIGLFNFNGCYNLTTIEVSPENPQFQSLDGVLFNKTLTTLIIYPQGKPGPVYHIPDSVTAIKQLAFSGVNTLTRIVIPPGLTSLGYAAFDGCFGLVSIDIPDGVSSIGDYAFSYCTSLTNITISDSVTSIGERAFFNCTSLTNITIPDSVTGMGGFTFKDCTALTSVVISDEMVSLPLWIFQGCSSLTHIVLPDEMISIGFFAFADCTSLTSIIIPGGVTSIVESTFYGCESLTNVIIPEGVTEIGDNAFGGCTSLTNIFLPDSLTHIGSNAFSRCASLTSIVIPDSVVYMKEYIFSDCENLGSITLGGGHIIYGGEDTQDEAFEGIPNLTTVLFNAPPHPNTVIAIQHIDALTDVYVWPDDAASFGGEGTQWNGLTVRLRDTSPKISSLSVGESNTTFTVSGGPDSFYILNHSIDLNTFTRVLTSPAIIKTDSNGTTAFTVETSGDKGFFILEQTP